MLRVLILAILVAVASMSEVPPECNTSYLEKADAVVLSEMTNKNATLSALCRWLEENKPNDAAAELEKSKLSIWGAYSNYKVSIRWQKNMSELTDTCLFLLSSICVCLSVCQSVCLSICLSVCLYVRVKSFLIPVGLLPGS